MAIDILMPALSPTMEQGKLAKWLKKEGDKVKPGDVLAEIETDKATMEVEAIDEGVLARILISDGTDNVAVNTPIAVLAGEGEDVSGATARGPADGAGEPPPAPGPSAPQPAPVPDMQADDMVDRAAPDARQGGDQGPVAKPAAPSVISSRTSHDAMAEIPEGTELVTMTVREALRDAMAEEMRRDGSVFVMGEEVAEYQGAYKVTQGLLQEFGPKRVVDTPITEQGFAGLGVGAAFVGLRPIVEFMTFNFAMQAIDHIINSAAKTLYMSGGQLGAPIVFRGPNGAASRVGAQHSHDYAAWYSNVPGLKVVMPYTASDAKGLLKSAIRDPNPVIFLENEILYGQTFPVPKLDDFTVPIGKARIHRPGKDVTIVSWAIGMSYVLKAVLELEKEGIDAEIIDLRTIRPMDIETVVRSLQKTHRCVVVEEGWPQSGVSAQVGMKIMEEAFDELDAPVVRVTGKDVPMPYAANLEKLALPNVGEVVQAVKAVTYR